MRADQLKVMNIYVRGGVSPSDMRSMDEEERRRFLAHPRTRVNPPDRLDLLSLVEFCDASQLRWDHFDDTQFSDISISTVKMVFLTPVRSDELQKPLIRKKKRTTPLESRNRIMH